MVPGKVSRELAKIGGINRYRRVMFHCVDAGSTKNADESFLRDLAEGTRGMCVKRVK